MKTFYKWSAIYVAILAVAFLSSFLSATSLQLFARDLGASSTETFATTIYSNTETIPPWVDTIGIGMLNHARNRTAAILLQNGKVLIAGGSYTPLGTTDFITTTELFDPATSEWSYSGNLNKARAGAAMVLLDSGEALLAGGAEGEGVSVELYDPMSGSWSNMGSLNNAHSGHTATLLSDGKVLVVGGSSLTAEVYDPTSGNWTETGNVNVPRTEHTATLLPNGKVLVSGGRDGSGPLTSAELYDPTIGNWSNAAPMNDAHTAHKAVLVQNGKVLVVGSPSNQAEVYDPVTDEWVHTAAPPNFSASAFAPGLLMRMVDDRILMFSGGYYWVYNPTTESWLGAIYSQFDTFPTSGTVTLISPTEILLAGGSGIGGGELILNYHLENIVTGWLTLPNGWLNHKTWDVSFRGISSGEPLESASLQRKNEGQGTLIPITPGETITTTYGVLVEGRDQKIILDLYTTNGRFASAVEGTVNVDITPPGSYIVTPKSTNATIPALKYSPATFTVAWQGSDATSGVAGYDLQVKKSGDVDWTDLLTNTTGTQTTFTGVNEETYFFRVRARDVAGNVEAWPQGEDGSTQVDAEVPEGVVDIAAVGTTSVLLLLDAKDNLSGITSMRVGLAEDFEGVAWEAYATTKTLSFGGPSPSQFAVYVQLRDLVGNISLICVSHGGAECPDAPVKFEIALPVIRRS